MSSPIVSSRLTLIFLVLLMAGICTVSITDWSLPRATLIKGWGVGGEVKGRREERGRDGRGGKMYCKCCDYTHCDSHMTVT